MISEYSKNKFSIREGEFEVLISHSNLYDKDKTTPELIKWSENEEGKKYCWALAFWEYDSHEPCWEIKSVGERLFTDIPENKIKSIWNMMKLMDHYLNYSNENEEEE